MQEQTGGERQMSMGWRRKSVFQHLSVNVICHSDECLRDRPCLFLTVCFVFLCHFVRKREGMRGCVCLKQKRRRSIYYPKVTYVFIRSLSFSVVEPRINESETSWIWILFIRRLTMWRSGRPYPQSVTLMMLQGSEGFHMPMSLPIMMNKSDPESCWWKISPLKGQPGSDPSAL